MLHFPRKNLAEQIVRALSGKDALSDAPNGLFLAAPRRTGKTVFLRLDLMPALERSGVLPVYVDLWEHKERDPGELIAEVIGRAITKTAGLIGKAGKAMKGVSVGPIAVDFDASSIGKTDGVSIPEALQELHRRAKKPVCLIIDEAQHALTSDQGMRAMASLKSARDQMNQPGTVNVMLVMSGSDRDKLLRLVNSNAAPFFGSQISKMPVLGPDFVAHVAKEVRTIHKHLIALPALEDAFKRYGFRPQFFVEALNEAIAGTTADRPFAESLAATVSLVQQRAQDQMAATFCALTPLQRAILWWMFEAGDAFRPYDAKALEFYRAKVGRKVPVANAQQALEALRSRSDPLVWKSARGEYAVDDSGMLAWYQGLREAGKWPPKI